MPIARNRSREARFDTRGIGSRCNLDEETKNREAD